MVLGGSSRFNTKNLSFKYLSFNRKAISFSINRKQGSAVLRNKFKRQSRSIYLSSVFKNAMFLVLVRPRLGLSKNFCVFHDFHLFKQHLISEKQKNNG